MPLAEKIGTDLGETNAATISSSSKASKGFSSLGLSTMPRYSRILGVKAPPVMKVSRAASEGADLLGQVHVVAATGGLMLAYTWRSRVIEIVIGPRFDLGWIHGFGESDDPIIRASNSGDLLGAASLDLRLLFSLGRQGAALLVLGLGYVFRAARFLAETRSVASATGALFSGTIGLARRF